MSATWHICTFTAKRMPPERGPRTRCEMETPRGQCSKWAAGGALYAWGAVGLCAKHLDEECGPEEAKHMANEMPVGPPLSAHGIDIIEATTDEVVTAICVMIRKAAEAHRDPSDPYPTSGTYAAASFAEDLADDIANGEWRKHLRTTHDLPKEK